jgi:hypothetical protein
LDLLVFQESGCSTSCFNKASRVKITVLLAMQEVEQMTFELHEFGTQFQRQATFIPEGHWNVGDDATRSRREYQDARGKVNRFVDIVRDEPNGRSFVAQEQPEFLHLLAGLSIERPKGKNL